MRATKWVWALLVVLAGAGGCSRGAAKAGADKAAKPESTTASLGAAAVAKGDCKAEYAPRPELDPSPMCRVTGGTFMMGTPESFKDVVSERPVHRATVGDFYMDQFEVTAEQYARYLNAAGTHLACKTIKDSGCIDVDQSVTRTVELVAGKYRAVPGMERHPAHRVSWEGAHRYCEWAGKRLPTEEEWEYAARHDPATGKDYLYPWGDTFELNRANCDEERSRDATDGVMAVGSFDGTRGHLDGRSPWGLHDMVGNVGEWVSGCAPVESSTCDRGYCAPKPEDVHCASGRISRDHGWYGGNEACYPSFRLFTEAGMHGADSDGFRCLSARAGGEGR